MNSLLRTFLCGLAMGAADVVPGVSGGTVAFITGIYDTLLNAIKSFNSNFFQQLFTLHFRKASACIPWSFLLPLLCGIALSLLTLARLTRFLLTTWPEATWAFFTGLILSSLVMLLKEQRFSRKNFLPLFLGATCTWLLAGAESITASHSFPHLFCVGFTALCAMILPGISGSFILVLLGQYTYILSALIQFNLPVLAVFMLGGLCGLMTFSRVLSACFLRYPVTTNAVLIGVLLGSLRTVWPWHGENRMPALPPAIDLAFFVAVLTFFLGVALPLFIQHTARKKENVSAAAQR